MPAGGLCGALGREGPWAAEVAAGLTEANLNLKAQKSIIKLSEALPKNPNYLQPQAPQNSRLRRKYDPFMIGKTTLVGCWIQG